MELQKSLRNNNSTEIRLIANFINPRVLEILELWGCFKIYTSSIFTKSRIKINTKKVKNK
jgi:hypothetical protein